MLTNRVRTIAILVLVTFALNIQAQNPASVTGTVTPEGAVRMIAHGESLQIRMEIYSTAGDLVYDSGLRQGNLVDWKPTDTAAQPMADGSHLVVVTVKDFKGNLSQQMAALSSQGGQLQLQNLKREELTPAQTNAVESRRANQKVKITEGDDAIAILREGKERSVVVTAHDGAAGQVNSTSGPLTFSTGNVFSNQEKEQLRITPDGRVGIGTTNPEATLDVAGTIKARGGIQFDDGTVIKSARELPEKDIPSAGGGGGGAAGNLSGTNIVTAINDPATVGVVNENRVSLNLVRFMPAAPQLTVGDTTCGPINFSKKLPKWNNCASK